MHKVLLWPNAFQGDIISVARDLNSLRYQSATSDEIPVTKDNIMGLHNRIVKWDRELGLDGVRFEVVANAVEELDFSITVHGWQCKGGKLEREIGGGGLCVHRQPGKESDDDLLASIMARAEKGFIRLVRALLGSLSGT
ncbi:MAG: hypothetical protein EOP06_30805, partial [Proteobacteria bacterium]